jgi:glycosyltransferase involved in cell wall biosynthesis
VSRPVQVATTFVAVAEGMGQQIADVALMSALREVPGVNVRAWPIGSMRSDLQVRRRLPMALLDRVPFAVKVVAGRASYPRTLVHRFDCRLPPARREVVTVHDVAPLRFSDEGVMPHHVGEGLRRALAVVCPSEFSADELREVYGLDRVHVVPNGTDPAAFGAQPLPVPERERLGVPERYVLHTGGSTMRKNLAALASAWSAVVAARPEVGLVLCGPQDDRRTALFADLPNTRLLGKVPRPTLLGLMAGAAAVVVPSVYEGYGLPAAEAMACGVPVVAARRASLPEVVGAHGILVEPDAEGLAGGVLSALDHPDRSGLAVARELARSRTWQASAEAYARIYRAVEGHDTGRPRR